jgi:hypothetical protein
VAAREHALEVSGVDDLANALLLGQVDADEHPPPPSWDVYPSSLADILESMVVTRWHGTRLKWQSGGIGAPVPGLYKKFDCVRHRAYEKTSRQCRTLLVETNSETMSKSLEEIKASALNVDNGVFVAFLGTDYFLSECLEIVKKIGSHFKKTYYESYDVYDDDVDVLPIGLSEYYLRFQDWNVLSYLAQANSRQVSSEVLPKEGMVLGAFGAFFSLLSPSRRSARKLCSSHAAEKAWLRCEEVPKEEWWNTLSSFAFILDPAGNGIQSSKFYEALLARAVPICTKEPAHLKLYENGWPMVLVDDFSEVADLDLMQIYEKLTPQLESIQPYLRVDGYWDYLNHLETGLLSN